MNVHEYQAKQLLAKFGVPISEGKPAFTKDEAIQAYKDLNSPVCAIKAQIHAGGRGKAGGVRIIKSAEEAGQFADDILGKVLVTHQTGPDGKVVNRLFVEAGCKIARELYVSLLVDRGTGFVTFVASQEGGTEIEEVAAETPDKIFQVSIDPATGFQGYHGRKLAYALGFEGKLVSQGVKLFASLYKAFMTLDASQIEINPLVVTEDNEIMALDAKVSFDSNALFRQPEVLEMRDLTEEDPMEVEASKHELNYIKLDGSIGCMVNGAGLAMATMDVIKLYGAEPANFLDVGGGASRERVTEAFKLIMSDDSVSGILVNIFGGIMRCDIIAEGIIEAVKELSLKVPLVVRLEGTNVEAGKKLLDESGLQILPANDLDDAASKIVKAVKEAA